MTIWPTCLFQPTSNNTSALQPDTICTTQDPPYLISSSLNPPQNLFLQPLLSVLQPAETIRPSVSAHDLLGLVTSTAKFYSNYVLLY